MKRLAYFIREAFGNIRLNRTTTVIAVATTAFTLACFGVFLLLYVNLKDMATSLQGDFKVVIYVQDGISSQHLTEIQNRLRTDRGVQTFTYLSKEKALADFREQFPSESHLLEGLGENPLPASFVVTLSPSLRSSDAIKQWAEQLRKVSGVDQVQYSRDWIDNLSTLVGYLELTAVGVGTILAAASVTIIASTIRLTLYARREEIDIMRMIGATRGFINVPFVMEGALLGMLGSVLSLAMLVGGFEFFRARLGMPGRFLAIDSGFHFFSTNLSLLIVAAGLLLGCLGSLISLFDSGRAKA